MTRHRTIDTTTSTDLVVEEPGDRPRYRHPSDLLRLLVALVATIVGFFLATTLNELSEAITVEVIEGFDELPDPVVVATILATAFFNAFIPLFAIGYLVRTRRWRRLVLGLFASAVAVGLLAVLEEFVVARFAPPDLPFTPPSWVCEAGTIADSALSCVPAMESNFTNLVFITSLVAFFSTLAPAMGRRWRRFTWIYIGSIATFRLISTLQPPVDEFLAMGLAYVVGAGVLLAFGERDRRPTGSDIARALSRSGIELERLRRADVDARGSTPYFANDREGRNLFVKVLTPEERSADILFRVMRMFRLKGVGDERPFSSLRRAVEHEAVVALKASADGVRTPELVAVSSVPPNSMLLAYEMIDGSSLDGVAADELTDEVLAGVWSQVATLRSRRIAHRDLRLANVFLDADQEPWLIDFGFAELAATDGQLRTDIAELTTSTATVCGPEAAVAAAIAGLGEDAVADAACRVQPLALSGATRHALKEHKGLDEDVRLEIQRQTGVDEIELEDLEKIKPRVVATIVASGFAIYLLIPQLVQTDFTAVFEADWRWAPVVLAASALTYVGAAYNIMGGVPDRVRFLPTLLAQGAASFFNRITPVKVGGIALNVRYLQKNGIELPVAAAGLGVSNVSTIAVHVSLLAIAVVSLGRDLGDFIALPSQHTVLLVLVGISVVAGLVVFLPFGRRLVVTKAWPIVKRAGQGMAQVASTPSKAIMLFGGAFLEIVAYIAALWFSLAAFGGGLGIVAVALVFLGGQALGNLAPTPGGIGATEAAIIAAMTALGLDPTTAVAATFFYRLATFWVPILPGFYAARKLESLGMI